MTAQIETHCGHPATEPVIARLQPQEQAHVLAPNGEREWVGLEAVFCAPECAGDRRIVHVMRDGLGH